MAQRQAKSSVRDSFGQAGLALAGGLTLVVEKGMHAGATTSTRAGALTIGSALDNDVVLISDQLVAQHARLSIGDAWRGLLRIEAKGGPIRTADGRIVDKGRHVDLTMPAVFQAGGAEFRVEAAHDLKKARKLALPALILAGFALLLPSIAGVVTGLFRAPAALIASIPDGSAIGVAAPTAEKAVEMLRGRLREQGLTGQVTIERGSSGNIVATGVVEPQNLDKWRETIRWFDAQGGGPLLLNNVTRADQPTLLPAFRAVWLDAKPQVVLLNGQTATVGDTISGGWKIEAIEPGGVVISRDGRTSKIAF